MTALLAGSREFHSLIVLDFLVQFKRRKYQNLH